MINKKLLAVATLAAVVSASSAFARTEGDYVGAYIMNTDVDVDYSGGSSSNFTNDEFGFGVDYKHAFNNDRFFVSPGAFFENNDVDAVDPFGGVVETNMRFGAKVDLGYDMTDQIAAYFTNGLAFVDYDVNWATGSESDIKLGYFYGLGLAYTIDSKFSVNIEYNRQDIDYDTPGVADADTEISVMKLGVSYHF